MLHVKIVKNRYMLEISPDWVLTLVDDGEKGHALKSANG